MNIIKPSLFIFFLCLPVSSHAICVGMIKQEYCLGKEPPNKPAITMDEGIYFNKHKYERNPSYNYKPEYDSGVGLNLLTYASIKNNKTTSVQQIYILESKKWSDTDKQFIAIIDRISKQYGKPRKVTNKDFYSYAEWKTKNVSITVKLDYDYISVTFEQNK